jgi:hypothetical protein
VPAAFGFLPAAALAYPHHREREDAVQVTYRT